MRQPLYGGKSLSVVGGETSISAASSNSEAADAQLFVRVGNCQSATPSDYKRARFADRRAPKISRTQYGHGTRVRHWPVLLSRTGCLAMRHAHLVHGRGSISIQKPTFHLLTKNGGQRERAQPETDSLVEFCQIIQSRSQPLQRTETLKDL